MWSDATALARAFAVEVELVDQRQDALVARKSGQARIQVSLRVHQETWGVFCVVHELAHHLLHPGRREFYMGSPGWYEQVESQANALALLALWPQHDMTRLPRILQIKADDAIGLTFHLGIPTPSIADTSLRWTSRKLTVRRYV